MRKNITVPKRKFGLGGPDPQMGGPTPDRVGALYSGPKGAHSVERMVSISLAIAEKIDFEENSFAPSSGEIVRGRCPISRISSTVSTLYNP